jgi:hypothetical protein
MQDFATGGYGKINANYPPILLHWFWLVGKFFQIFNYQYPPQPEIILKYIVLFPILILQLFFSLHIEKLLVQKNINPIKSPLFWGVVCSPPLLLNGPIWGQVDFLPFYPILFCLIYGYHGKILLSSIFFAVALMCKFQAILILPIFAGLCFKNYKQIPLGIIGFSLSIFIGFLPFLLEGRMLEMMAQAYWGNLGIYPYATYNAANIWYILVGNTTNVNDSLFSNNIAVLKHLSPKNVGTALFGLISLYAFFKTIKSKQLSSIVKYALVLTLTFFVFAPSMHERYLFLLVPFTAYACAQGFIKISWFVLASILVSLNINLILPINGQAIWHNLAWLTTLTCLYSIYRFLFEQKIKLPNMARTGLPLTIFSVLIFSYSQGYTLYMNNKSYFKHEGKIYLSDINYVSNYQAWGSLGIDKNISQNILAIGNNNYAKGLGAHAKSEIKYRIPKGSKFFHAYCGLDKSMASSGSVQFKILLDNTLIWYSDSIRSESITEVLIPLKEEKEITLIIDPLGNNSSDHANWGEAAFWEKSPPNHTLYLNNKSDFKHEGKIYLSDMNHVSNHQAWGLLGINKNVNQNILVIGNMTFTKGLGVHAKSELNYSIPKGSRFFHAYCGLDKSVKSLGSVQFKIFLEKKLVWSSDSIRSKSVTEVLVPLNGEKDITLVVDPLGNNHSDHANWGKAAFWEKQPKLILE